MSNQILLKKSSVADRVPGTGALAYGELAINYTDGKLYYKTASNTVDTFASISATATLTNKTLTSPVISGGTINNAAIGGTTAAAGSFTTLSASSTATFTGEVLINNSSGGGGTSEGGELHLAIPTANSTLSGPIAIDIYQNKVRIFETTGTNRGVYIDLTTTATNAGTNLVSSGSGTVTSITAGTGLSGGTITTSGTIAISNTAVTAGSYTLGNFTVNAQGQLTAASSTSTTGSGNVVLATSPTLTTPVLGVASATSVTADAFIKTSSNIITDATTSRTLSSTDNGKIIYFTSSSAVTVTTAAGLGAGFSCEIIQGGTGAVTVAAGSTTTVNSPSGLLGVKGRYAVVRILAPVANTFIMTGDYETNYILK